MVPWGGSEACVLCPKPSTCEGRLALPVSGAESRYLCVEGCRGGSSKILSFLSPSPLFCVQFRNWTVGVGNTYWIEWN